MTIDQSISESSPPHHLAILDRYQDYLGEVVYGGIDGSITTFAVVAGATGAELSTSVVLILGFANLLADGFSMSIGAYLAAKADADNYEKHKQNEYREITVAPEAKRATIMDIYKKKGFEGDLLEKITQVICKDKDQWVNTIMKEELELIKENRPPYAIGLVTYASFLVMGLVPLFMYLWSYFMPYAGNLFLATCFLTLVSFCIIGFLKAYVTETSVWKGILETIGLGISAATVAYFVGDILEKWVN